jgi:hypothetical protein
VLKEDFDLTLTPAIATVPTITENVTTSSWTRSTTRGATDVRASEWSVFVVIGGLRYGFATTPFG